MNLAVSYSLSWLYSDLGGVRDLQLGDLLCVNDLLPGDLLGVSDMLPGYLLGVNDLLQGGLLLGELGYSKRLFSR